MKRKLQLLSVAVAWLLVAMWLWFLAAFPASWQNPYDCLNQVVALMAVSFAMLVLGVALCAEAALRIVRWPIARAVVVTPLCHWAGSVFEPPICMVLFIVPSCIIVMTSVPELRMVESVTDNEP